MFIALAIYLIWQLTGWGGAQVQALVDGAVLLGFSLAAAGLAVRESMRAEIWRRRAAWLLFAVGLALLAGEGARALFPAAATPWESRFSPLLRLGALGFFGLGLLIHPRAFHPRLSNLPVLLNPLIGGIAALATIWLSFINPVTGMLVNYAPIRAYLTGGFALLLLLLVLFLASDPRYQPSPFGWLTAALVTLALASLLHPVLAALDSEVLARLGGSAWALGAGLFAAAAVGHPPVARRRNPRASRRIAGLQNFLPHILTLMQVSATVLTYLVYGGDIFTQLLISAVLVLMIITRQGIQAGQTRFQQYANLVNSVAEPAFVCDDMGLLRLVNPALQAAAGYPTPGNLLGKPLGLILDSSSNVEHMLEQALARQANPNDTIPLGWSGETRLRRRDGSLVPIYLSLRLVSSWDDLPDRSANRLALAGTAHDLTRHKQQQAALQQAYEQLAAAHSQLEKMNVELEQKVAEETANLSQAYQRMAEQNRKLQALDQLKSDFVSLVSHELRSPLTNINGGIELVLSRPGLENSMRSHLELVQSEILRLTRFVETILDLSALDSGHVPLYLAPISYEDIVSTLQAQLVHRPGVERIRWQPVQDIPYLMADDQALNSVLYHLLDNALKYAPQGEITVTAEAADGRVNIHVLDSGPGIPLEDLPLLFDRFFRSNARDSQTVYGHGLGLYIVRRLVDAMGGQVEASNRPEGGACFTCRLRLAEEAEESHAA